jgi:predicted Rossmann-fold nucleotide-binding protein
MISAGGIIITPGSLGTVQEVFQCTCRVGYADEKKKYPIVFFGVEFWQSNGVFSVVQAQAKAHDFENLLLISDDVEEIVSFLVQKAVEKNLYLLQNPSEELLSPFWFSKAHC